MIELRSSLTQLELPCLGMCALPRVCIIVLVLWAHCLGLQCESGWWRLTVWQCERTKVFSNPAWTAISWNLYITTCLQIFDFAKAVLNKQIHVSVYTLADWHDYDFWVRTKIAQYATSAMGKWGKKCHDKVCVLVSQLYSPHLSWSACRSAHFDILWK